MAGTESSPKLFWVDPEKNIRKTYDDLILDINTINAIPKCLKNVNTYQLFVDLLSSMLTNDEYVLLDSDWSSKELMTLGMFEEQLQITIPLPSHHFSTIDDFLAAISAVEKWRLGFFTSGTTGRPKYISHNKTVLARNVKTGGKFNYNQWGFCYNPTHFAGIQVFFQAIYNKNTMVNMFHTDYGLAEQTLQKYSITHISATPTYYRSIYPYLHDTYPLVERLTFGGEMFDEQIVRILTKFFPNAKVTNVYASTELGSILAGRGNTLKIPNEFSDRLRISDDGELQVHKSLMGKTVISSDDAWFSTGDLVEIAENGTLRFISRKSEMINVGGYKVNPHEIEEIILELPYIRDVIVYGRENRITGRLIAADVMLSEDTDENIELLLQEHLKSRVQEWKIPRIVKIVNEVDRTRTGKKVRK